MAWKTQDPNATKHTCGGPKFGHLTPGCPRCEELKAGAAVRSWGGQLKRDNEARLIQAIHAHDCKASKCGPVCTAFDW